MTDLFSSGNLESGDKASQPINEAALSAWREDHSLTESLSMMCKLGKKELSEEELTDIDEALSESWQDVVTLARASKLYTGTNGAAEKLAESLAGPGTQGCNSEDCKQPDEPGEDYIKIPDQIEIELLQWAVEDTEREREGRKSPIARPSEPPRLSAEDEQFLQMIFDGRDEALSAPRKVFENRAEVCHSKEAFTDEEWEMIGEMLCAQEPDGIDIASIEEFLPEVSMERSETEVQSADEHEIRQQEGRLIVTDRESDIVITRDGEQTETTGTSEGAVISTSPEGRSYRKNGKMVAETRADGTSILTFENGLYGVHKPGHDHMEIYDRAGNLQSTVTKEQFQRRFGELDIFAFREAGSAQEALAALNGRPDENSSESKLLLHMNGAAIARNNEIIVEFAQNDNGTVASFKIDSNRQLVRKEDGTLLIRENGKEDVCLSDQAVEALMRKLGRKASFINRVIEALDKGEFFELGGDLGGARLRINRGRQTGGSLVGSRGERLEFESINSWINLRDGKSGDEQRYDTETGNLVLRHEDRHVGLIDMSSEKGPTVETEDYVYQEGETSFSDGVVFERDGDVRLPSGTTIEADGDIRLADGSLIDQSGHLHRQTEPIGEDDQTQRTMEAHVKYAEGLARSIAGRAAGGAITLSDIALLRANLIVLTNFINLYSSTGNLQAVNDLSKSWALLRQSLGRAEHSMENKKKALRPGRHRKRNPLPV